MPSKELVGEVVSNKMDKTVTVAVEVRFAHPKYEKMIVKTNKFKAHDEGNKCQMGDVVRIRECRPLSSTKRWLVVETVGHAEATVENEEGK